MNTFNWHSDAIHKSTVINQSYKNTQNVRRFFKANCGEHFTFNRPFMKWMKDNQGKTMGDAVLEWLKRDSTN